jgi:chorismate mutase / prephenate dehydratase
MTTDENDQTDITSLNDVRRKIDAIDDHILDLLMQRFAVTAHVQSFKKSEPVAYTLPLRPGREMAILKRLIARAKAEHVNADFVVRLWRVILNQSSQKQSPITLHVSKHLNSNMAHRLRLRDHFGPMQVEEYKDEAQALLQIDISPQDLCVVETESHWGEAFMAGRAGKAQVIACLPVLKDGEIPKLLVLGAAPVEASGADETLVMSDGKLPRDFVPQPLWQVKTGSLRLSCLPGFLQDHEGPLLSLGRSNASLKLKIAGRFASAIENENV